MVQRRPAHVHGGGDRRHRLAAVAHRPGKRGLIGVEGLGTGDRIGSGIDGVGSDERRDVIGPIADAPTDARLGQSGATVAVPAK